MFETLYKDPATIERYRRAPLLEDRERYLCAVVASGVVVDVARRVARRVARTQLVLLDLLNLAARPRREVPLKRRDPRYVLSSGRINLVPHTPAVVRLTEM